MATLILADDWSDKIKGLNGFRVIEKVRDGAIPGGSGAGCL